jgi:hypothetical protein
VSNSGQNRLLDLTLTLIAITGLPAPGAASQSPSRDFLATNFWAGKEKSRCRASLLLPLHPRQPPLTVRFQPQTNAHRRCLPLLAPTKHTKKLEKARKTRPFIDPLVEGSRPHALTTPYAHTNLTSRARAHTCCAAISRPSRLTERIQFSTRHPFSRQSLRQTYVRTFLCPFPIRTLAHPISQALSHSAPRDIASP